MPANGPAMTDRELLAWRRRMGWPQDKAAAMLGRSRRIYQMYELGRQPVPHHIFLSCIAIETAAANPAAIRAALGRITAARPQAADYGGNPCVLLPSPPLPR